MNANELARNLQIRLGRRHEGVTKSTSKFTMRMECTFTQTNRATMEGCRNELFAPKNGRGHSVGQPRSEHAGEGIPKVAVVGEFRVEIVNHAQDLHVPG